MNVIELRRTRAEMLARARQFHETAEKENRGLTQEEQNNWDQIWADAEVLEKRIANAERVATVGDESTSDLRSQQPADSADANAADLRFLQTDAARSLTGLATSELTDPAWQRILRSSSPAYRTAWNRIVRHGVNGINQTDVRALQATSDTLGGYLLAPMQFVNQLIKAVDDAVYIRQWATVIAVPDAQSLGVPTLEADPADADWTSELGTGNEDSTMSFGQRSLTPHPLAKRIKISRTLLNKLSSAETLVRNRLAYKFAITQEKGFLTGTGVNSPLGVFTASTQGISTSRDVSTDNTTTAVTMDGLINAKFSLKMNYWPRARWLFHRDAVKMISKLKDGNGEYIWRESTRAGEPDRLLGLPVFMSEYAPNTFTTGLYVGLLGDFSNYWIADSLNMEVQRLVELYAATNQVGLIGRMESDGMPVLEEAFARVKLA